MSAINPPLIKHAPPRPNSVLSWGFGATRGAVSSDGIATKAESREDNWDFPGTGAGLWVIILRWVPMYPNSSSFVLLQGPNFSFSDLATPRPISWTLQHWGQFLDLATLRQSSRDSDGPCNKEFCSVRVTRSSYVRYLGICPKNQIPAAPERKQL